MTYIEVPFEDLSELEFLGNDPVYRFEELLNETNRNDLEKVINSLELDISSEDIDDYEIRDDLVILYIDDIM